MQAAVAGQMMGRGKRLILVDAAGAAVIVVMMSLALEVHQRMLLLFLARHPHGNACMGQRLPAHAQHQQKGRQAAAHECQFSGAII